MRVLVVEDEPALAESIAGILSTANMIPTLAGNGVHALAMIEQSRRLKRAYDAILLDLSLPGMDGMDVLKAVRKAGDQTPVLILTARRTLADRVDGLETGADDYLAKPFETVELLARLRAITRRRISEAESIKPSCGNLSLDAGKGYFTVEGAVLTLPPKQHAILEALFRRRNQPVNKDFLMNMDDEGSSFESVHTQISRLRKRLQDAGCTAEISTQHGFGYMLEHLQK
ncbi:response regulator transcription factor [Paucibacter soli]|uniref:response regulator transcription factor n=1 Tax=Paucibacter soli TaxID=3133433 RepID=UPI0030A3BEB4